MTDTSSDEWAPVIRYVMVTQDGDTPSVWRKEYITCPLCAPIETAEPDRDDETVPDGVCVTDGAVTVCTDENCPHEEVSGVQIKPTTTQTKQPTIGPHRDTTRTRYEHSGAVALVGGIGHL